MKLLNNTPMEAYYNISSENTGDCGAIAANQTLDLPQLNNQKNVTVTFIAVDKAHPFKASPFSMIIPKSGAGMTVTIGLYQQ